MVIILKRIQEVPLQEEYGIIEHTCTSNRSKQRGDESSSSVISKHMKKKIINN